MRRDTKLMLQALRELMESPFPGDKMKRTGAQLMALAMFREALGGSIAAAKEITDRVEGKVKDMVEVSETMDPDEVRERLRLLVEKLRGESGRVQ